jgi:SAM-dependent methyltransferase
MSERAAVLLEPIPKSSRIIEIGPSFSPIAPKSGGWNSASIDHMTREGLVAEFTGLPGVDISRIEDVDFVWQGGPLYGAVPPDQHGTFDAFVASHVIEHTPDLIAFLDSAETLLKPDGLVILAVPDRRYCFDYFQPLTTTGQILDAHKAGRSRHSRRLAFDHFAYATESRGLCAWGQEPISDLRLTHSLEHAVTMFTEYEDSSRYLDLHAWRFVPASFELLLLELARLGETDWRIDRITAATGCEFFAWLRRGGAAAAASLSADDLNARRLLLLKQSMLEVGSQIGSLLAGEPDLALVRSEMFVSGQAITERGGQVVTLLTECNRRVADLEAQLTAANARTEDAVRERHTILNSTAWRATAPFRRLSSALPAPAKRALRLAVRAAGRVRAD